ncbi:MAG: 50S ribosomal protein L32 [Actinomycetes bacterium]|nr:50S ribosomal protein L32 [Solirubrobacterales bacterium]
MAVPKQKQSHSRTNKRRSQHRAAVPTVHGCPSCGAPAVPHRVCAACGNYRGRQVLGNA